jgi:diadenosine tetraphosphate (Ap4A) HIT family hydrolase
LPGRSGLATAPETQKMDIRDTTDMNEVTKKASPHFKLDERLEADCEFVANLGVCSLLLMNNASVPWFILVPTVVQATELTELPMEQQQQVLHEMNQVAAMVTNLFNPDKLNIGALGNVVSQLHIHVIGRFTSDPAWPNPVWGQLVANTYSEAQLVQQLTDIRACLKL